MKAKIIEGCIGCEVCTYTCPEVFRMGADGFAEVYSGVTDETAEDAKEAAESCPVSVIIIEE